MFLFLSYLYIYTAHCTSTVPIIFKAIIGQIDLIAGITNFDLLGNFGSMEWLGNFYIILASNLIFAGATGLSLTTKFTSTITQELFNRLHNVFRQKERSHSLPNGNTSMMNSSKLNASMQVNSNASFHAKDD